MAKAQQSSPLSRNWREMHAPDLTQKQQVKDDLNGSRNAYADALVRNAKVPQAS